MPEASYLRPTTGAHPPCFSREYCAPPPHPELCHSGTPQATYRLAPNHDQGHVQHFHGGGGQESCYRHSGRVPGSYDGPPGAHGRFLGADSSPSGDLTPGNLNSALISSHHEMGVVAGLNGANPHMGPQVGPQGPQVGLQGGNFMQNYHGGAAMAGGPCMASPLGVPDCRSVGHAPSFVQLTSPGRPTYGHHRAHAYAGPHCPTYGISQETSHGYDAHMFHYPAAVSQEKTFSECRPQYNGFLPALENLHLSGCEPGGLMPKVEPEWRPEGELQQIQPIRPPRRRRRNSEKRKEKSRDAARHRRGKESVIMSELASALPLPPQTVAQLDKASIMRLTLAFLETRAVCEAGLTKRLESSGSKKMGLEMDEYLMKALDGFLLVVSTGGDVVYTSENIVTFLGLLQVDVMGHSLYDYTNTSDFSEVKHLTAFKNPNQPRRAFLRLKCTLTSKGRSVNFKNATDKVVQVVGEVVGERAERAWLVALATPVPHPSNIEFPLDKQTFVSRHSLDMKFTYVDSNVKEFCGYSSEELVGRSMYEVHHALDTDLIQDAYKNLLNKGQVETSRYRFLARAGGYVWLVTQATLIHGPRDNKPQYVVCLNYVVSGVESSNEILSEFQLMCNRDNTNSSSKNSTCNDNSNNNNSNSINNNKEEITSTSNKASLSKCTPVGVPVPPPVVRGLPTPTSTPPPKTNTSVKAGDSGTPSSTTAPLPRRPPVASTLKFFAPRTEDMNKGYLTFNGNDPHSTVLKEEPEDLTHLAPSGGDTCVRLLEVPSLISNLEEDSRVPQEVSTLSPSIDDMFTIDYQMPSVNSDAVIPSPSVVKAEDHDLSPKYLYEENSLPEVKCVSSLSGGRLLLNRSRCCTPSPDCSSLHSGGLGTPEPPKPLLSQAALPPPNKKQPLISSGGSCPRTTTESFFMPLEESNSGGSSELFGRLDQKFDLQAMDADEFDMRAPFIPNSNELLSYLGSEYFVLGAEPELAISPKYLRDTKCSVTSDKEDSSLAQLLRDTDPPITGSSPGRNIQLDHSPGSHGNQYQQSKFLEGGGSFVDPNKVLPGHFAGKDELDSIGGSSQLVDPPPVLVQETVEPPPPLLGTDSLQVSGQIKRGHSPLSSPTLNHKKLRLPTCHQQQQQQNFHQRSQDALGHQHQQGGIRLLTTPIAPTMQQLLTSKDPITVRGGRPPSGGTSASKNLPIDKSHSVLRNLLNINEDNSIVLEELHGGGLSSTPTTLRLPKEKVATMLLASSGGKAGTPLQYPTFRLVAGNHSNLKQAGHLAFKLTSSPSSQQGEGCVSRLGQRQDSCILMNSDTIPTLLELTQQDYEVNAPTNNSLQGAELLMALDQSNEAALLDG